MISTKAPKTNYLSINDVGKFTMIWDVSVVLIPIFFTLFAIHFFFGDQTWISSLVACLIAVFNVVILFRTRKYEAIAIFSVIIGVLLCQAVIFVVEDSQLISNVMWSVLISFFAFFMLNTFWGTLILLINLSSTIVYLFNADVGSVSGVEVNYKMVVDVVYVALALAYVVHKIMANNKLTNQRYEHENKKNEVLLKEIHHRVKNNLQIISSLLKLQAADAHSEILTTQFDEAIGRIKSMALIHEKMYHNDDLSHINVKEYLISLSEDICSSICSDGNLTFDIQSDIEMVGVKSIVPVSLIFNELLTNSMKHGFQGAKTGHISLKISLNKDIVECLYKDNGSWKEPKRENTFGLDLLDTLTQQLDGSYVRDTTNGTMYFFKFDARAMFPAVK